MITKFIKADGVLDNSPFIEEEVRYHVFHRISEDDHALLMRSDDSKIIAARTNIGYPMWLFVSQTYNKQALDSMLMEIRDLTTSEEQFELVMKPDLLDEATPYFGTNYDVYMDMESFECNCVKPPEPKKGVFSVAQPADLDTIAEFCKGFIFWGFGKEVTVESQLEGAKRIIESGNLYTLTVDGRIVSMANIAHRSPRHARINYVYTPESDRGNGFASELVADLSMLILDEGLTPVLFTDLSNKTSNKIYQTVGYQPRGKVTHYVFKRKNGLSSC